MSNRRKPTMIEPEQEEYIGHITTPLAEDELERVCAILKRHKVTVLGFQDPNDLWRTFLLPDGTTKMKKEMQGKAILYIVRLPDGFSFLFQSPVFHKDKYYLSYPWIVVTEESADVQR